MEEDKHIWRATFLLAAVAGYCDTVTFVTADSIFSAHVTGNFIVFASQVIRGSESTFWIKLLTFPTFVISVMLGGKLVALSLNSRKLLLLEGILLLLTGIARYYFTAVLGYPSVIYPLVMCVVFAMGLQNTFNKLFSKEIYGPTTIMTGNVTQASLDLGSIIFSKFKNFSTLASFKKELVITGGFLLGCVLGAILGKLYGFGVVSLAGMAIIFCYLSTKSWSHTAYSE